MRVLAFAQKGAANRSESFGQRENVVCDQQVGVFRPYGMPINAFGGNRNFGHQVGTCEGHSFGSCAAQRDPPNHPVFGSNVLLIEESPELLSFSIA